MRHIVAFIFGLGPFAVALILCISIYAPYPNFISIVICLAIITLSIWVGRLIYKQILIHGIIDFLAIAHSSPDIDNLEPQPNDETKRRQPQELVDLITNNNHLFKGGSFKIFGDWFGKPYKKKHLIKSAEFKEDSKVLILNFKDGKQLIIVNPIHIFEASTFIKILKADSINLTWYKNRKAEKLSFIKYKKVDNKIKTFTNVYWYKPIFDVSLGDPALIIFG